MRLEESSFFTYGLMAPNLMVVCLDASADGRETGRLYSCYSLEPAEFPDKIQMLLLMEDVMENINFPQSSVNLREYGKKEHQKRERPKKMREQRELFDFRGTLGTYAIRVQYRQNATWQGEIAWMEQNMVKSFSSELEMLKLMDNMRE